MASRKDFIIGRPTTGNSVTFTRFSVTFTFALALLPVSVASEAVAPVSHLSATSTHALPRLTIRQPQSELAAGTSPIHSDAFFLSLHFCGIWWSLRIMFPTLGLFFIEFNLHLRKEGKENLKITISAWVLLLLRDSPLCIQAMTASLYQMQLFIHKTSVHAARNCRHLTLSSSLLFSPSTANIYSLAVVSFFFRLHMANDYMHLWHLITLLFCHLMSCKLLKRNVQKWFNIFSISLRRAPA